MPTSSIGSLVGGCNGFSKGLVATGRSAGIRLEVAFFDNSIVQQAADKWGGKVSFDGVIKEIHLAASEVSQVLFRLSRWENLEYAKKI